MEYRSMEVHVFERSLPASQIYPCSLADIERRLADFDHNDLKNLWSVGLVPTTRAERDTSARYIPGYKPVIYTFAWSASLAFTLRPGADMARIKRDLAPELESGMQVFRRSGRWVAKWEPEELRNYTLGYLLAHEVGHHVYHLLNGGPRFACPDVQACERFAHDFAMAHSK